MLKDISIGRFYQTDSVMHSLDPRIKVILFVVYMVVVFMTTKIIGIAALLLVLVSLIILGKIPLKVIWNTIKPMIPITIIIFIINILTIGGDNVLWTYWKISITSQGLKEALLMSFRLLMLVVVTSLLMTLTTTPLKLSEALEKLFMPLTVIKVPVHEMAMMMSIALRFIPTLIDETDKIMKAQSSRGANYDTGSFIRKVKGYITVLVPLFISSFRRAEELATAMDARCYNGGKGRTKLNPLKLKPSDFVIGGCYTVAAATVVVIELFIG